MNDPFKVSCVGDSVYVLAPGDTIDTPTATFRDKDTAEIFVRAKNSHDELINSLKELIGWTNAFIGKAAWNTDLPMKALERARIAFKKAIS